MSKFSFGMAAGDMDHKRGPEAQKAVEQARSIVQAKYNSFPVKQETIVHIPLKNEFNVQTPNGKDGRKLGHMGEELVGHLNKQGFHLTMIDTWLGDQVMVGVPKEELQKFKDFAGIKDADPAATKQPQPSPSR